MKNLQNRVFNWLLQVAILLSVLIASAADF